MGMNGNPLGSRKVIAAQKRIGKEQKFLQDLRVLTPANSEVPEHQQIVSGEIKSIPAILQIADRVGGVLIVDSKAAEVPLDLIRNSLRVIRDCSRVLARFGGA